MWGVMAIGLGLWEAAAFASRRRVPTVSAAAHAACERTPAARVVIAIWAAALAWHLTRTG